ncbi:MAG: hypothetical protein JNN15_01340 [Blastocatellia bacterium]|nr:hypothetical protein [Blastocatellia bacterium]
MNKFYALFVSLLILLFSAYTTVAQTDASIPVTKEMSLKVFDKVWKTVNEKYYDPKFNGVDWQKVRETFRPKVEQAKTAAELYKELFTMLNELKDGHTTVRSPLLVKTLASRSIPDLGFSLRLVEEKVVVTEVKPLSSAEQAGIEAGWVLTNFNSKPIDVTARQLNVDFDQQASFQFIDREDKVRDVSLSCCSKVAITPVRIAKIIDDNILFLRFDSFEGDMAVWLKEQLSKNKQARGLIIDLRKNRGGKVTILQEILDNFFSQKTVFGEFIARSGKESDLKVGGDKNAYSGPVTILVDKDSVSAAEIFSIALQETKRGTVIGRKSRGSVLLSFVENLPDGGQLQFSTSNYLTQKGARLEGNGVTPDISIDLKVDDLRRLVDRDLERAIEIIKKEVGSH